jgi:hypothetical protein
MAIYYSKDKSFSWHHHKDHTNDEPALDSGEFNISAPTYSQCFRWFREKDYYSEINVGCTQIDGAIGFSWRIWKPWIIEEWSPERPGEEWSYETYEEAESACLDKLIEICKNK